jgi:peroxiredoxin
VELQTRLAALRDEGLGLAVISYDPPAILAAFAKQRGITFPLLSDVGSVTIRRYGILNTVAEEALGPNRNDPGLAEQVRTFVSEVGANERMVGIPFPGTFVLDRQGVVRSRFFEDSYIERNTVSQTLLRLNLGRSPVEGTQVSTDHLQLKTYPGESAVAPGNRLALALEITPGPGMHVYAPGAAGYRVIALTIDQQPFLRVLPMSYPDSEIYLFEPLNERVPVYQRPFTLLQDMVLEGHRQAQAALKGRNSLTITGRLDYQACDDKICFNPVSIPLSWTVGLKPIIFERPTPAR